MKNYGLYALLACSIGFASCNSNASKEISNAGIEISEKAKSASFTVDGAAYKGNVTTQYFADKVTGQFSVLCQQDEPFALLQAVFKNEKEASGSLKPAGGFYSIESGETNIALSGTAIGDKEFVTKSNSTGSITVSGKTLIIKDLKLFNSDNKEKIVNASIAY
jgi:hypothetical protein